AIAGADKNAAGNEQIAGFGFLNIEGAALIEAPGKHLRKTFRHVLNNDKGGGKIAGNLGEQVLECVGAAGGYADGDHTIGRKRGMRTFLGGRNSLGLGLGNGFRSPGALGDFNLLNELESDGVEMAGGRILRLGNEIDGAQCQGFEGSVGAFLGVGAEHDDGKRSVAHDHAQGFDTVHAGHFEVQGDDIGMQFRDFTYGKGAIHGSADDLDVGVALKNNGDQFPHQSGIIDHQDFDALFHAMAPKGSDRDNRERMAGTFKNRTTVPSPRMEAPLTRSLATMSPGRALMTSSSSPTRLSTTKPKRFSATPMTMTKLFFFFSPVASTAWMRLRPPRRTRVRICSRSRRTSRWSTRVISCSLTRLISMTEERGTAKRRPPTRKSRV